MNAIRIAALVLSVLFTPVVVFAQALPNADASAEFVQLQLSLNSEAERIDEIVFGLERDLGRLRSCLGSLRSDQNALRAELEARIGQLEAQLAEIPELRAELADLRASVQRGILRENQLLSFINVLRDRINGLEERVTELEHHVDDAVRRIEALERDVSVLQHNALRFGVGSELGVNADIETGFTTGLTLGLRYGVGDHSFGVAHARLGTSNDGWDFVPAVRLTWLRSLSETWGIGGGVASWIDTGARNVSGFEASGFSGLLEARAAAGDHVEFHLNGGPSLVTARGGRTVRGEANFGLTWWFGQ